MPQVVRPIAPAAHILHEERLLLFELRQQSASLLQKGGIGDVLKLVERSRVSLGRD